MAAATPEEGGVIANETGHATASEFVTYKDKTIGLLIGRIAPLGDMPVHMSFFVAEGAFAPPKRLRRKAANLTEQDRHGLHSFECGDVVAYQKLETGEAETRAAVFGCISAPPVEGDNEVRRMLILYDMDAGIFFLGTWPSWRRVCKASVLVTDFDCDNNEHVQKISGQECQQMLDSWKHLLHMPEVC